MPIRQTNLSGINHVHTANLYFNIIRWQHFYQEKKEDCSEKVFLDRESFPSSIIRGGDQLHSPYNPCFHDVPPAIEYPGEEIRIFFLILVMILYKFKGDMIPSIINLTVIETHKCPLYQSGDEFRVSQNILYLPNGKPACLILSTDIERILMEITAQDESEKDIRFDCRGCIGVIRLAGKKKFLKDQIRYVRALENVAKILSNFSMFQSLDRNQIEEIVTYIRLARYVKGEVIIRR